LQGDFLRLRTPNMYNLRADPIERGTESQFYSDWLDCSGS
jgi:arylsulfatase